MNKKRSNSWLVGLGAIISIFFMGFLDWLTGYKLNFFVFYFLPISLGAWFFGYGAAVVMSVLCAIVWAAADIMAGQMYLSNFYAIWNTLIRLISFLAIGWSVSKIRELIIREREMADTLRRSLSEIKVLEGFLPICSQCKKIRNEEGEWEPIEGYIGTHSDATFSHSYCPECAKMALEEAGLTQKSEA